MEINENWIKLYRLAAELYQLAPWKYLEESDIFGLEIPDTGKQYFISIMGSAGVLSGISAYDGASSLASFWELNGAENPDASDLLNIPHLILSFEEEKTMDQEQLKRLRSLGFQQLFSGYFPEARHNIPGRFPYAPSEEVLTELLVILEQTLAVAREAKENPEIILPEDYDEGIYLIRKKTVTQGDIGPWTNHYQPVDAPAERYRFNVPSEEIDAVISLPVTNAAMQAHSQLLPLQVEHNGSVYFSYISILVNKRSGRVENVDTMIADPDYHTMLEKVPAVFIRFIKSLGFRPRVIEVKSELLFEMLKEPFTKCGIRLNKYNELPAVTEAVNSILEYSKRS